MVIVQGQSSMRLEQRLRILLLCYELQCYPNIDVGQAHRAVKFSYLQLNALRLPCSTLTSTLVTRREA